MLPESRTLALKKMFPPSGKPQDLLAKTEAGQVLAKPKREPNTRKKRKPLVMEKAAGK